jgi:deazaflavin-dependent oxidoreductase (nitroreductase family)
MTEWDRDSWENAVIADLRGHRGVVSQGPLSGQSLLIMTSTGAISGEPRRAILTWSRDGSDYVVAATANGAPSNPAWVANVRRTPTVTVEAEGRTVGARATVVTDGPERDRLWAAHVALLPDFAPYPEQSGRLIPMVRLTPESATD